MLLLGLSLIRVPGRAAESEALLLPPKIVFSVQLQMSLFGLPDPLVLAYHGHGGVTVTRIQSELLLLLGCM
jgi:hypothetical protein